MRKKLQKNNTINERRVFQKYLARYLLIVLFVIGCCVPFGMNTYSKIKEYAIATSVRQLEDGIAQLDNNIERMQMIASMLGEDSYLLELKRISGDIPMEKYLYLKDAKNRLSEISNIYDFADTIFCVFKDNDAFVSDNQVSDNLSDYYGTFISMDDMSWQSFRDTLMNSRDQSGFLHSGQFSYFQSESSRMLSMENAVLYLQPVGKENFWSSQKAVIAFAINRDALLDLLLPEGIREDALLAVTDRDGQNLVTYGENADILLADGHATTVESEHQSYQIFHYEQQTSGLHITVGFPMNTIWDQMVNIGQLLFIYVLCGSAGAVLLTILCTIYWYRPFGKMLGEVSQLSGRDVEKKNEYDYIRESLLKLVSEKDEMETKMLLVNAEKQAIMTEKIFINGFSEPEMKEQFIQQFPFAQDGYFMVRILVRQLEKEVDTQLSLLYAMEVFQKEGGYHYMQIYPQNNMTVLLVADEKQLGEEKLCEVLHTVRDMTTASYAVNFVIGISQRQSDIDKISVAFAQARQTVNVYKVKNQSYVEMYQTFFDTEKGCFHMENFRKVYDLVLSGNRDAVRNSFTEMKKEAQTSYEKYGFRKFEIYYAIGFVLESVCQQKGLLTVSHSFNTAELQNMDLLQCLDSLEDDACKLCDLIEQSKSRKNSETKKRLLEYMQNNFKRPELTVDLVAREVDTSEKYVYAMIKEQTGNTFSTYLDELRVAYAKECLETTGWSNEKIAEEAGFGAVNSFYRIFKKYTDMSPSIYRKSKINN